MKKISILFATLFFVFGFAQAQDIYFAGNGNGTGKIWKNDTLVYSLSDSLSVSLQALQVTPDEMVYSAGFVHDTAYSEGRVWLSDSLLFSAGENSVINSLILNENSWTAAGYNKNEWNLHRGLVWHNGEILHAFSDSLSPNQIYALCLDSVTGDLYSGGSADSLDIATVWKNDSLLWNAELTSTVCCLHHDGTNLYAGGYYYLEGLLMATAWENGEVLYSFSDSLTSSFQAIAVYDGDIYTSGFTDDSIFVWKNGAVLHAHSFNVTGDLYALCVNEYGVYYAGQIDHVGMIWKDGEVLYQPDGCEEITSLVVLPSEPTPVYTLTVEANNDDWGTVSGGGEYPLGDTATIEAFPNMGCEFLYWSDSITDNPRDIIVMQDSTFIAHFRQIDYFIETLVSPEGTGMVTGGGNYHYGDTITLEAIANPGFAFDSWDDGNTSNPRTVVVTQDSTFIASFVTRLYTITVLSDNTGWGWVSGSGDYHYLDTIQISATAYLGFEFVSWTDDNTDNPRTVVVTEDHTYTAHFNIQQCLIKTDAIPQGAGTVNGGGIYNYGTTINLSAHSNQGYFFDYWTDGAIENPRSVFVEGNASYTAVFSPKTYEITTISDPVEGGTVSGGGSYHYGDTVTLTATPNPNYMFLCWSDGIPINPRSFAVTQNATYTALFYRNGTPEYTVNVLSNNPDLGIVTGSGTYPENTSIQISAIANEGAVFKRWNDGISINPRNIYVTQDTTFTAFFEPMQTYYTIDVESDNPLMGTVYGGGSFLEGTEITIGATPNHGFHFASWQDGNTSNPRTIMVTSDATYTASFAINSVSTYTVTIYYDENQGFVIGAGTYNAGSTATLAAIPADGYQFVKWGDEIVDNPREIVVDHDIVLAAFFNANGVDENDNSPFSLYPNPSNERIRVEGLEEATEISIFNSLGMGVKTDILEVDGELFVGDLPSGLYFVRIGKTHLKFIKH